MAFRAIGDSLAKYHLEGSECCLIHADNPLSESKGVFINPKVRVGYNPLAYNVIHPPGPWLSRFAIGFGLWKNRLVRWFAVSKIRRWREISPVREWEMEAVEHLERGENCLVNEMQVLAENGWAHV